MIKKLLLLLQFISGISASSVSQAAWFDSIIYDMDADQNFIARRVLNNTGSSKLYNVSAVRIDKPGVGGENASPLQHMPMHHGVNHLIDHVLTKFQRSAHGVSRFF